MNRKEKVNLPLWKRVNYNAHLNTAAQLGTLLVVTFGYFYTIQPVFQHQLLAEKNAQIELDKVRLESEISDIEEDLANRRRSLEEVSSRNKSLEESVSSYENEIDELLSVRTELEEQARVAYLNLQEEQERSETLLDEVEIAEQRELFAIERVEAIQQQVQNELNALENARWELILTDMQQLDTIELVGSLDVFGGDRDLDISEYLDDASKSWPNVYLSVLDSISKMESSDKYPKEYLNELRELAALNIDILRCERPDFTGIEEDYYKELEGSEERALRNINEQMDEIRNDYADDGKVVSFADGYFDTGYSMALMIDENQLDNEYKTMVSDLIYDCSFRRYDFYERVAEIKGLEMSF